MAKRTENNSDHQRQSLKIGPGLRALRQRLNHRVFWPPFLLLIAASASSLLFPDKFHERVSLVNDWILDRFDWLFSYTSFFMVILCIAILFSPIGKMRIGGKEAKPLLNRWRWFSIILCTTVAVGILFWGTAEPMFHLSSPPSDSGVDPMSQSAARFSMGTLFLHWSFTPYAIYAIPALLFAIAYYNRGHAFSLGSMLFPILKHTNHRWLNDTINVLCLFALVAGMAASLGAGLLSMNGGAAKIIEIATSPLSLGVIALVIVITFTASSASGLLRGIRMLSSINMAIFMLLVVFVFAFGPTASIIQQAGNGLVEYSQNFLAQSLMLEPFNNKAWTHSWTTFYWANWMAWAPVTALFLGRIAYGYTVREFMLFNWIIPAVFSIIWMSVFSGTVMHQQLEQGIPLVEALNTYGPQSVVYEMISAFPLTNVVIVVFLFTMFISYVTAADSNTMAMSGLSSTGISPDDPEPSVYIQLIWGVLVGLISWVMVSYSGVDGIKILSNLGGLPAVILLVFCSVAMVKLLLDR